MGKLSCIHPIAQGLANYGLGTKPGLALYKALGLYKDGFYIFKGLFKKKRKQGILCNRLYVTDKPEIFTIWLFTKKFRATATNCKLQNTCTILLLLFQSFQSE